MGDIGSIGLPVAFLGVDHHRTGGLLVYRGTLSSKEDDQLYLNKAEIEMMGRDQAAVITKLNRLGKPIWAFAILSGILLLASASLWVWMSSYSVSSSARLSETRAYPDASASFSARSPAKWWRRCCWRGGSLDRRLIGGYRRGVVQRDQPGAGALLQHQ